MSNDFKWFRQVVDGSTLEVWVEPEDGELSAAAKYFDSDMVEASWTDSDLRPGPRIKTLEAPKTYTVWLWVTFGGDADETIEATMKARVLKPDGETVHGATWEYPVSGKKAERRRGTIWVTTKAS